MSFGPEIVPCIIILKLIGGSEKLTKLLPLIVRSTFTLTFTSTFYLLSLFHHPTLMCQVTMWSKCQLEHQSTLFSLTGCLGTRRVVQFTCHPKFVQDEYTLFLYVLWSNAHLGCKWIVLQFSAVRLIFFE